MNTDLDFERELRQIARALVADAPDVPAFQRRLVVAEQPSRRFVPLTAAAAVVAVGVAGLVVAGNSGDSDPGVASGISSPNSTPEAAGEGARPTSYPVIDDLPDNATAELTLDEIFSNLSTGPRAGALIGEVADGRIVSTLVVRAGVRLDEYPVQPLVDGVTVFGVAGSVYEDTESAAKIVLWGTPPNFESITRRPYLSLTGSKPGDGADPIAFLEAASPDFATFTAASEQGPVEMTVGDLPEGFELLAGPESVSGEPSTSAFLRVTPSGSFVQVSSFNPLIEYGEVGAIEQVDIAGKPGWVNETGDVVVWQVDESTWARARSLTPGEAVALAQSVSFVDEATWTEMYDPQPSPTGPEFVPITGPIAYPDPSATTVPESVPVSMP